MSHFSGELFNPSLGSGACQHNLAKSNWQQVRQVLTSALSAVYEDRVRSGVGSGYLDLLLPFVYSSAQGALMADVV